MIRVDGAIAPTLYGWPGSANSWNCSRLRFSGDGDCQPVEIIENPEQVTLDFLESLSMFERVSGSARFTLRGKVELVELSLSYRGITEGESMYKDKKSAPYLEVWIGEAGSLILSVRNSPAEHCSYAG